MIVSGSELELDARRDDGAAERDNVAALLDGPIPNERYFLAVLGAIDWLDGDGTPRHSGIGDGLLAR